MRKFDLKQPIHRIGQSVVYYDTLDSMTEKCRSMQGVKGIDGTVIFADRIRTGQGTFDHPCSFGLVLKPETLPFKEKQEVEPVMMGAFASVLEKFQASFRWPHSFVRDGLVFGVANCSVQKIKDRWVYVIVSAEFDFGEAWSEEEQEVFFKECLSALDLADQSMRDGKHQGCLDAYRTAANLIDRKLSFRLADREITGVVQEITEQGDLIVKQDSGRKIRVFGKKIKVIQYLDVASK
jgi:hypothetical protein